MASRPGAPGGLPNGSSGESQYRWSYTTSASRRGSPSAPGGKPTPIRVRPPTCWRAIWRDRAGEPRTTARAGRANTRGPGGCAQGTRGTPRGARRQGRLHLCADTAELLEDNGVISNAGFFELRARLEGRSGELRPGPYSLREDMSYDAVLDTLEKGVPPNVVMVTVPEGRSRREI